ncbi:MAG: UPF0175 family protein [Hormoscilla sp. GM7CHS1pb]|nr:UPF0175 family protein [Hormoscilla sp. GM7CHS1pb]
MKIAIEIPDKIAKYMEDKWGNMEQRVLEITAAEAYRDEAITHAEVGRILGLGRYEVDGFLKKEGAYLNYTLADLEQDVQNIRKVRGK